jgi:hypothetical protein
VDPTLSTQLLSWFNALSLPALVLAAWKISRWLSKKEADVKESFTAAMRTLTNIRDNHLHHVQLTLDEIKVGQDRATEQTAENTSAIVAAQNASKDAIVQAIISTKGS